MAVHALLRRCARLLCRFPGNKLTETLLLLLLGGSKVRAGPNFRRQLNNNDTHTHVFGWWVFRYDHAGSCDYVTHSLEVRSCVTAETLMAFYSNE